MPELPDVEAFRMRLEDGGLGRRIVAVSLVAPGRLLQVPAPSLRRALEGKPLTATRRHGKWLFARAGAGPWLALHFGMTGDLRVVRPGGATPPLRRAAKQR